MQAYSSPLLESAARECRAAGPAATVISTGRRLLILLLAAAALLFGVSVVLANATASRDASPLSPSARSSLAGPKMLRAFLAGGGRALVEKTAPGRLFLPSLRQPSVLRNSRQHRFVDSAAEAVSSSSGRSSATVKQQEENLKAESMPAQKMDLNPPRGTRDFFPDDMRQRFNLKAVFLELSLCRIFPIRNWLFGKWKSVAALYGFEEYDAPVVYLSLI